ncbi:Protein NPC2 like protein [Trachymyrmex zeteki]|uniref:Protein NPC2 like protein n=1 Tax=Mycetomoellerius zeteki TaxID=64791 RepID=A0A151X6K0_9HYME|nr:PREDICTED: protein NPC2 homolog [Trachymyrmex zeteki]KYQ56006.1 Protein NPC2 like protein [Trachymyrmex zeteki]
MMRISVAFSLLCVLCGITSSLAFVFEDCGSEAGKLNEISISSCDVSDEKCSLPRGKDIKVFIKFTPSRDISDITAHAFGVLLDVPIPFPLKNSDVCKDSNSGVKCPLKKDQETEFKNIFNVDEKTPAVSVNVMWEFRNEKDEKIICIKFPVKVV